MPILPKGGRKSPQVRLIVLSIYAMLILGSATMVYPFLLMLSCSVSGAFDFDDFTVLPKYLRSDDALMKKHLYDKYSGVIESLAFNYGKSEQWIVAALNRAYGTTFASFAQAPLPFMAEDYHDFQTSKSQIRRDYFTGNYQQVLSFLVTKGRAIWVTLALIVLAIASSLTVNPLAAYALSRGNQSTASKFLIFFLAASAFPAEVAMIPGFLLLKDLGLLNSFAALILPGLASGYSIFLLKGFFDSIPRELYEAAHLDGANEFQSFWMITFPMSTPILAVIALGAFTAAYGGFMWAFLTCQDPKMWTIMVWLYDFQGQYSGQPGLVMAALAVASIPTLLVFLFCQKIIMKGIVIPTMK